MDASPDFTIVKNCQSTEWCNTLENLGSDHYILSTTIRTGRIRKHIGTAKLTDWRAYRNSSYLLGGSSSELGAELDDDGKLALIDCILPFPTSFLTTPIIPLMATGG
ncbi:hypothetical protein HPB50_002537 [Hyalomma asiaticum]|uniref:Uncharacterized protein n=1 Tax=Hyalomma asiaticum TaxID=266040 RepID=A0ACB7SR32_HYAAI|nr:hypothetical protein HPB50_002537 [Hyalomma asiaticum]